MHGLQTIKRINAIKGPYIIAEIDGRRMTFLPNKNGTIDHLPEDAVIVERVGA